MAGIYRTSEVYDGKSHTYFDLLWHLCCYNSVSCNSCGITGKCWCGCELYSWFAQIIIKNIDAFDFIKRTSLSRCRCRIYSATQTWAVLMNLILYEWSCRSAALLKWRGMRKATWNIPSLSQQKENHNRWFKISP